MSISREKVGNVADGIGRRDDGGKSERARRAEGEGQKELYADDRDMYIL